MPQNHNVLFSETAVLIEALREENEPFRQVLALMAKARGDVSVSKKTLRKTIDESWVTAIESAIPALDTVIRNYGRDIRESEEVLPIELSRHISPRSLQHLGQHSDYIKEVSRDGTVTPSKILNVFRDETLETYENKFVNTLVDRLQKFIYRRYDKLREAGGDETGGAMSIDMDLQTKTGSMKLSLSLSAVERQQESDSTEDDTTPKTLWERVERLKRIVDRYSQAPMIVALHGIYVRPPIMRTNAILKNQYLKQCLILWQFIESYDKVGYQIDASQTLEKPKRSFIEDTYSLLALQYLLFYYNTMSGLDTTEIYRTRSAKALTPRFKRSFEDALLENYDLEEVQNRSIAALFPAASRKRLTSEQQSVRVAIDRALKISKQQKTELNRARKKQADAKPRKSAG